MPEKRETGDAQRPTSPEAGAVSEEDLAAAQEIMEEYEAKGIEDTIPYSQFRSKWLGPES